MRWSGLKGPLASHQRAASLVKRATSSRSSVAEFEASAMTELASSARGLSSHEAFSFPRGGEEIRTNAMLRERASVSMKEPVFAAGPHWAGPSLVWRGPNGPVGAQIRRDVGGRHRPHQERRRSR